MVSGQVNVKSIEVMDNGGRPLDFLTAENVAGKKKLRNLATKWFPSKRVALTALGLT